MSLGRGGAFRKAHGSDERAVERRPVHRAATIGAGRGNGVEWTLMPAPAIALLTPARQCLVAVVMLALLAATLGLGQLYVSHYGGVRLQQQRFNGVALGVPRNWEPVSATAQWPTWTFRDPQMEDRQLHIGRVEDPASLLEARMDPVEEAEISADGLVWRVYAYEYPALNFGPPRVSTGVLAIAQGAADEAEEGAWVIALDETARIHRRHAADPRRRAQIRFDRLNRNFRLVTSICRSAHWPD